MVRSSDLVAKWGSPTSFNEGDFMKLWDIPEAINKAIPTLPNKIYCNKALITSLEKAFNNIIDCCLTNEVKTWDGCFNIRMIRRGHSWSTHSWGISIDINAAWNRLGKKPQMSPELVACFTDAGFDWGGTWKRLDGMHFQLKEI